MCGVQTDLRLVRRQTALSSLQSADMKKTPLQNWFRVNMAQDPELYYFDAMKRQDEMAAVVALAALVKLDGGDIEKAKSRLHTAISIYYRGHRDDGDSNVLRHITAFAATNAALSNAIYRKLE